MVEKRVLDRREQPPTLKQMIKNLLYRIGVLIAHPAQKAREEYRDNSDERDRRNRRARRDAPRNSTSDRRTASRRD